MPVSAYGGVTEGVNAAANFMKTASELEMQPQKAAYMQERIAGMKQEREIGDIQIKQEKYKQEKQARQEKIEKSPFPLEEMLSSKGSPEATKKLLDVAGGMGITYKTADGKTSINNGDVEQFMQRIKLDNSLQVEIKQANLNAIMQKEGQMKQALQEEGNPKKKEEIGQQLQVAQKERQRLNAEIKGKTEEIEGVKTRMENLLKFGFRVEIPGKPGEFYPVGSKEDIEGTSKMVEEKQMVKAHIMAALETGTPQVAEAAEKISLEYMKEKAKGKTELLKQKGLDTREEKKEISAEKRASEANKTRITAAGISANKPKSGDKVKITGNVAINPETNKEEYLMTDGSFSGKTPGAKPGTKKEGLQFPTKKYKSADEVKADFKSGKLKEAEAVKILNDQFNMK